MIDFYPFFAGALIAMIIDIVWFNTSIQKIEKGFEAFEHYHFGLIFIAIATIPLEQISSGVSSFLFGSGLIFVIAEWRQFIEIKKGKVIPGHPFAYGSMHFRSSTAIGILIFLTLTSFYIWKTFI